MVPGWQQFGTLVFTTNRRIRQQFKCRRHRRPVRIFQARSAVHADPWAHNFNGSTRTREACPLNLETCPDYLLGIVPHPELFVINNRKTPSPPIINNHAAVGSIINTDFPITAADSLLEVLWEGKQPESFRLWHGHYNWISRFQLMEI